ncbi:MAG: energy transducer TonB [Gammaproteobacteria bacterium]|nr:MAG: energy transducer TonB [Gammaproteobacteria bacterium]
MTYIMSTMQLPWSFSDDDQRFKKILTVSFIIFFIASIPVTLIKLPELTRKEKAELPPQLARVMLEKQELPPPKPIEPPKVEEKKPEEKKPEEKKSAEKPVEKAPVPVKSTEKPVDRPQNNDAKSEAVANAKAQAQAQISTFKDDLMEMREALQTDTVETAAATVSNGAGQAAQVDRSMINSGKVTGSGGINVNAIGGSRDVGGVALSGRETTKVKSGLAEASKKAAGATGAGGGNSDGAGGAARSEEEIRKIMEQYKASFFSIYNRALKEDATLQGKVVVKIVIDPTGQVIDASIVSSELNNPALEAKIIAKIKSINFSTANVAKSTINYSFDFLPQ